MALLLALAYVATALIAVLVIFGLVTHGITLDGPEDFVIPAFAAVVFGAAWPLCVALAATLPLFYLLGKALNWLVNQ